MRIGLIAPPWVPVPPSKYGGTEEVVDGLARGLALRGHDVHLFTVGSSTCDVRRSWYFDAAVEPMGLALHEAAHVVAAYESLSDVDVIHDHTTVGPLLALFRQHRPPVVTTNHGIFGDEAKLIYQRLAREIPVVAISQAQRASAPEIPIAAVIHHGIDLQQHSFGPGRGGFLLFVGRMSPEKGVHRAINVARLSGKRLVVAAKMRDADELSYFDTVVRPLLGPDVELLAEPSVEERIALLQQAAALVNPISWDEPFGLVMAEALACGTPVLTFSRGAAPEIVDHGRTGFLCADEAEMADAVHSIASIDRRVCRREAEVRFGASRMARDHEALYRRVLSSSLSSSAVG